MYHGPRSSCCDFNCCGYHQARTGSAESEIGQRVKCVSQLFASRTVLCAPSALPWLPLPASQHRLWWPSARLVHLQWVVCLFLWLPCTVHLLLLSGRQLSARACGKLIW